MTATTQTGVAPTATAIALTATALTTTATATGAIAATAATAPTATAATAATARDSRTDEDRGNRSRRRRSRDRYRDRDNRGGQRPGGEREPDTQVNEDDVLIPVAGILDLLDNYAFVRTSGYLPGPNDVYVSLSMVRKYGLRKGDAITGEVRQIREGERKEKFNPLVRFDTVNGADPEASKHRIDFSKLTPLYPQDRLRLETERVHADDAADRHRRCRSAKASAA